MTDRGACSRCAGAISEQWESGWPIACRIVVGRAGQMYDQLTGDETGASKRCDSHPAVRMCNPQKLHVEWHNDDLPPLEWAGKDSHAGRFVMGAVDGPILRGGRYLVSHDEYNEAAAAGRMRRSPYRLCFACHDQFLEMLGRFLGLR